MERPAKKWLKKKNKSEKKKNQNKKKIKIWFGKCISICAKDAWYTRSVYLNKAIILSLLADKAELHLVACCWSLCLSLFQSIVSALFLLSSGEVIVSDKYGCSSYSFVYINWLIVTLDVSLSDILIKDLTSEDSQYIIQAVQTQNWLFYLVYYGLLPHSELQNEQKTCRLSSILQARTAKDGSS